MPWVAGEPVRIVLAGIPKALERNRHRIVTTRSGAQFVSNFLPAKSRNAQATLALAAERAMNGRAPFDGTLELRFVAYLPVPESWSKKKRAAALADQIRPGGKPDVDNLVKLAADALKGVVWRDDALVTDAAIWKRYSDQPRTVIEVRTLTWEAGLFD